MSIFPVGFSPSSFVAFPGDSVADRPMVLQDRTYDKGGGPVGTDIDRCLFSQQGLA